MDPNSFRRDRLYCEEVADVLEAHAPFVKLMYNFHKSIDRSKFMEMEHLIKLLDQCNLIGQHTGISKLQVTGDALFGLKHLSLSKFTPNPPPKIRN